MRLHDDFWFTVFSVGSTYYMHKIDENTWQVFDDDRSIKGYSEWSKNAIILNFESGSWINYKPKSDKWDKLCKRLKETAGPASITK